MRAMSTMRVSILILVSIHAAAAGAREYPLDAASDLVGGVEVIEARFEDTFFEYARRFNVGFDELRHANPDVDPLLPGEGTPIVIPTQYVLPDAPRSGIVINIPEYRLYYFPPDRPDIVITHPIGIGREGRFTPYGQTTVVGKRHLPTWTPPASVREEHAARGDILPAVVPPGPDNPLGEYALYLGFAGYLIHGTNAPAGLGMRVSAGCIRMFPADIESLFGMAETGTPVTIVNQPYKLGWGERGLYLEAHRPLVEETEEWTQTELTKRYVAATDVRRVQMRWRDAEAVMTSGQGIPEFVSVEGTITVADLGDESAGPDDESDLAVTTSSRSSQPAGISR
jgi:L,D-transpeptidase ErfK/SrfK